MENQPEITQAMLYKNLAGELASVVLVLLLTRLSIA
jgi:hypothetical protein